MYIRYAKLILNDEVNCDSGFAVSLWMQGCPHRCRHCFNPETWDPVSGGQTIGYETLLRKIIKGLNANGVNRALSILGGEPLAEYNVDIVFSILQEVKNLLPNTKVYLWTGYLFNEVPDNIKAYCDVIIDGPFIEEQKDLSLKLRGSKNQHIYKKNGGTWVLEE